MGIISRFKRRKFFRYDLAVNDGSGWKQFGDYKEFLAYKDIENPDPGSVIRLYGVYKDSSQKEGWGREMVWEKEVPMPGGGGKVAASKKEKPVEERLMEKIVEGADFSGLKPTKLSIPLGKTGGSLDFESPVHIPVNGDGSGYMVIDGNRYPTGNIPPLEFDGKLPAWMHPAAGAMIMGLVDKFSNVLKTSIGGAITQATGIKAKEQSEGSTKKEVNVEEPIEKPPDLVDGLDELLSEDEKEKKVEVTKEKIKKKEK